MMTFEGEFANANVERAMIEASRENGMLRDSVSASNKIILLFLGSLKINIQHRGKQHGRTRCRGSSMGERDVEEYVCNGIIRFVYGHLV